MILYHATPAYNLPLILNLGLDPTAPGKGASNQVAVHLSERRGIVGLVEGLYRGDKIVLLAVDVTGLDLIPGDDGDDDEWAYPDVISADRIRLATDHSMLTLTRKSGETVTWRCSCGETAVGEWRNNLAGRRDARNSHQHHVELADQRLIEDIGSSIWPDPRGPRTDAHDRA